MTSIHLQVLSLGIMSTARIILQLTGSPSSLITNSSLILPRLRGKTLAALTDTALPLVLSNFPSVCDRPQGQTLQGDRNGKHRACSSVARRVCTPNASQKAHFTLQAHIAPRKSLPSFPVSSYFKRSQDLA